MKEKRLVNDPNCVSEHGKRNGARKEMSSSFLIVPLNLAVDVTLMFVSTWFKLYTQSPKPIPGQPDDI
jgi:hypothetical protein